MYHLLEKNVEELDRDELAKLTKALQEDLADDPLMEKLVGLLKDYQEGKVRKSKLMEHNHAIRSLLTILKKNKEDELRSLQQVNKEEEVREQELDDALQCPHCGHFSEAKQRFCSSCGRELYNRMDKVCYRCNAVNPHPAKFCMHCGARFDTGEEARFLDQTTTCPFCGKQAKGGVTEKSAFVECKHCGAEWGGTRQQYEQLMENL